jgi:hypothetical protein
MAHRRTSALRVHGASGPSIGRRGIQACEALSERFRLHMFKSAPATRVVFRRRYRDTSARSKRRRTRQEQAILDAKSRSLSEKPS